jgi:CTP:molybdopterin cytidylyltransferase MocA
MILSAVVPAAGNSGRMGRQKALLPVGNGLNFATNLVAFYTDFGCDPVILVINRDLDATLVQTDKNLVVVNHQVVLGRLYSIQLGLQHIPEDSFCFIHNVDNPYLEMDLLRRMAHAAAEDNYVVPVYNARAGHPALLGSRVIDCIRRKDHQTDFREILKGFTKIEVPCSDERILWNINTPGEYEAFLRWQQK